MIIFIDISIPLFQDELVLALAETEAALAECDTFLTTTVWRYKVCKFHAISQLRLKIQELKIKAAILARTTTPAPSTFQPADSASDASDA